MKANNGGHKRLLGRLKKSKDATDRLIAAAAEFVEERGGKVLVSGGVGVINIDEYKYMLTINMLGTPPARKDK